MSFVIRQRLDKAAVEGMVAGSDVLYFNAYVKCLQFAARMPTKIFVGNVAVNTARESMLQLFQRYGYVTECDVLGNYAFVVRINVHANICVTVTCYL